jgi:hypothetical protein
MKMSFKAYQAIFFLSISCFRKPLPPAVEQDGSSRHRCLFDLCGFQPQKSSHHLRWWYLTAFFCFLTCTTDHVLGPDGSAPRISVMADTSISVNDSIVVRLAAATPGSNDLKFIWDVKELKIHDTLSDSVLKIAFHRTGRFSVVVEAVNAMDLVSGADTIVITVFAKAPLITKISADSISMAHDTSSFSVASFDSDGVIKEYLWSFDNTSFDTTIDSTLVTVWPFVKSGTKTLFVKVRDDDGLVSKVASLRIAILPGAPTVKAMNDTSIMINDSLALRAFAFDTNGTIKEYYWSFDKTHWDITADPVKIVSWSIRDYGTKTLYVQAIDNDSLASNVDSATIKVRLGEPQISAMADTTVAVGDTVTLHANAIDSNGGITKYVWTTDGKTYDTTATGAYRAFWPVSAYYGKSNLVKELDSEGIPLRGDSVSHGAVAVYAVDNDGIFTETKYRIVNFRHYAPVFTAVHQNGITIDTMIACIDSLYVAYSFSDTNGLFLGGSWRWSFGWMERVASFFGSVNYPDSTRYIKYDGYGGLNLVIMALYEDENPGADVFHVLINRPPASCGLKIDYTTDKGGWSDYNYSIGKGSIPVSFLGNDPDGNNDKLTYDFFWGTDQASLAKQYSGPDRVISINGISPHTLFYWQVVAKDLYGDSISQEGTYTSPNAP